MRLPIKKVYCTACKKLVSGIIQKPNGNVRLLCPKCGIALYEWQGLGWRHARIEV